VDRLTDTQLRDLRGKALPMTQRQAFSIALLALEHVVTCGDDSDKSFERARRYIWAMLRNRRRTRK